MQGDIAGVVASTGLDFMRDQWALPIEYHGTAYGHHYTRPVTQLPALHISEGELAALFIAQKALAQHRGTVFEKPLRAACDKLAESLQGEISVRWAELDAAVSFRSAGASTAEVKIFEAVSRAVLQMTEIAFHYHKLGTAQVEQRRAQPYHLACMEQQWYLLRARSEPRPAPHLCAATDARSKGDGHEVSTAR